jgi:hypothetical protein
MLSGIDSNPLNIKNKKGTSLVVKKKVKNHSNP